MAELNEHLKSPDRFEALNNPRRWADPGIHTPPAFNVRKFQKRINRVIGTSVNGQPIVRLVWAWDEQQFEAGEIRQKYRFYSHEITSGPQAGKIIDISPPRWILEERHEPEQYLSAWNRVRYVTVPDEFSFSGRRTLDALGAPPTDGWYLPLWVIAEHDDDNACCLRMLEQKRKCWGCYREPSDIDLNLLAEAKARRDATPFKQSPHEPLTPQTVAEAFLAGRAANEAEAVAKRKQLHELWLSHVETWGWRIGETNPKRLHHGRWHLMPQKMMETPSGLMVPDHN